MKFGVNQIDSPAPKGFRNFRRAWNIALVPAIAATISGWGFANDSLVNRLLLLLSLVSAIVNAVDMFLGSDDVIVDQDQVKE
jgi:hypothetical protein